MERTTDQLTANDPRYRELFDAAKDAVSTSGRVEGDLTPRMSALRDQAPVMKGSLRRILDLPEVHMAFDRPREHYTLFSFALCERAFRENLLFSSAVYKESPGVQNFGRTILEMTGEEHRNYRGMVQPLFVRPKALALWKPAWIDDAVDALLDRLVGWKTADLNLELCARLPVHVVTRGIGMDNEDALTFREHLQRSTIGARSLPPEEAAYSRGEVFRMLKNLVDARRAEPRDDVMSSLAANEFALADGGSRKLTDAEIFGYCRLIMLAGGGTTWRQLGITLHALLKDYRLWAACRDDRGLVEKAVDESMRWMPTDPTFPRLMTQDVELAGVRIPAGARIDICLGAANRDPSRWENPDAYDPMRPAKYHLGFGLGPHQCLGMNVAKQEMITALNGLMDRFPNLRLDPDAPPAQLHGGLEQRGMSAVPVLLH
jgi:cytochrome P450